jgi:hypothetical protein
MKKQNKPGLEVTIVNGDDWVGLYVNGKIVVQGHSLTPHEILGAVDIIPKEINPDMEWLDNIGHLPENLSEVKKEE